MKKRTLNPKWCALMAAIEAGLLPKIDDETWDNKPFEKFWELFTAGLNETKDLRKQCAKERNQNAHRYRCALLKYLPSVFSCFLGYFIAVALLKFFV